MDLSLLTRPQQETIKNLQKIKDQGISVDIQAIYDVILEQG